MAADNTPEVTQVPVKRHEVNLTLEDILVPLTQATVDAAHAKLGAAPNPELAQHLQNLTTLAGQLRDVVSRINQIDPTLLAPTTSQPNSPPK